ncbi:hypothetical protein FOZ60_004942 [Perkinsus olseni]|uniref:Reverse transcriptase domain-containing protein n=1 Tax=Perkinsus olseni TaxID=32597 RepID=A0A7J6NS36_PEROL|nr:hypothetical protein FOZ60_004942 [Perkinsus olseni]
MKKLYRQGNVQGYRLARNDYRRCISQKKELAFGAFLRSISDLSDADLYKKIKRTPSLPCRLLEDDIDVDATLDRLASHYVGTQNLDMTHFLRNLVGSDYSVGLLPLEFENFTLDELSKVLKRRQTSKDKAPGDDGIRLSFIINAPEYIHIELLRLINYCIKVGVVLPEWRLSKVIFLNKMGKDPKTVKSLRPISLTSTLGKTCEFLILERLNGIIKRLYDRGSQYGFIRGRSTINVVDKLCAWAHSEKRWAILSTDFSNAFGEISHSCIEDALRKENADPALIRWIMRWLRDRGAKVIYGGHTIDKKLFPGKGCPQGGGLSPCLFILGVGDIGNTVCEKLQEAIPHARFSWVSYADDAYLLISWKQVTPPEQMRADIEKAYEIIKQASGTKDLALERTKCQVLSNISSLRSLDIPGYVTELNVLGVLLTSRMNFFPHIKRRASLALQAANGLLRFIRREAGVTPIRCLQVYEKILIPRIGYGIEIYDSALCLPYVKTYLDRIGNLVIRAAFRLRRSSPIDYLHTLSGFSPLSDILWGKALVAHFHKGSLLNVVGQRAKVQKVKFMDKVCAYGFEDGYRGESITFNPYLDLEIRDRICIVNDSLESLRHEEQCTSNWKAYTDGSVARNSRYTVTSVGAAFYVEGPLERRESGGVRLPITASIL